MKLILNKRFSKVLYNKLNILNFKGQLERNDTPSYAKDSLC